MTHQPINPVNPINSINPVNPLTPANSIAPLTPVNPINPVNPFNPFTSALPLSTAIRRKEISPVEVADHYLNRIDQLDPALNAFSHQAHDDVRKAAARAADAVMRAGSPADLPPFLGVPLPVKDFVDVAGWPTSYGSAAAGRGPAQSSDPVVRRFVDAGFVLLGKTTTSEFATFPLTEDGALGTTRSPWDPDRTPGGSSSGAGVAVAAGMAPVAHAEDGGGSIRIPASCTGLVGLKPTRGRVTNVSVEAEGLGTHGVLTRTVADTAALLDVLARHDPGAWWSPPTPGTSFASALEPPKPLRVGVLLDSPVDGIHVHPACVEAVDVTLRALEAAGHHIVDAPLPLPPAEELLSAVMVLMNVASAGIPLAHPERIEPRNRALRAAAREVDSWAYAEAVRRAQRLSRRVVEDFVARFDVLVTPTMACLPPLIGAWRAGVEDDPLRAVRNIYPMAVFTSVFSVTGQPAVSVPVRQDAATGLPVGVQLAAAPWREDLLLRVARTLEVTLPWADRHPSGVPGGARRPAPVRG